MTLLILILACEWSTEGAHSYIILAMIGVRSHVGHMSHADFGFVSASCCLKPGVLRIAQPPCQSNSATATQIRILEKPEFSEFECRLQHTPCECARLLAERRAERRGRGAPAQGREGRQGAPAAASKQISATPRPRALQKNIRQHEGIPRGRPSVRHQIDADGHRFSPY